MIVRRLLSGKHTMATPLVGKGEEVYVRTIGSHYGRTWKTIRARSLRREKTFLGKGDRIESAPVRREHGIGAVHNNSFVFERSRSTDFDGTRREKQ